RLSCSSSCDLYHRDLHSFPTRRSSDLSWARFSQASAWGSSKASLRCSGRRPRTRSCSSLWSSCFCCARQVSSGKKNEPSTGKLYRPCDHRRTVAGHGRLSDLHHEDHVLCPIRLRLQPAPRLHGAAVIRPCSLDRQST